MNRPVIKGYMYHLSIPGVSGVNIPSSSLSIYPYTVFSDSYDILNQFHHSTH